VTGARRAPYRRLSAAETSQCGYVNEPRSPQALPWKDTPLYAVTLGGNLQWRFCAGSDAKAWLETLARILCLRRSTASHGPAITFIETVKRERFNTFFSRCRDQGLYDGLPSIGWRSKRLGLVRFWYHPAAADMICQVQWWDSPPTNIVAMADAACVLYHGLADSGAFPVHAALLELHGRGVLLAGEGGVGKTTCCRRVPEPWTRLCDDEALIVPGPDGSFCAHPFPTWSDLVRGVGPKSWQVERGVPLSAIFFLAQAPQDKAIPLGRGEAAARMTAMTLRYFTRPRWKGSHPEDEVTIRARVFDNVCRAASQVPSFELRVLRDGRFWNEIERVLAT
jgi:SynChlorMet cassette protein ScmC